MGNRTVGEICSVLSGYAFDSKLFTENPQDKPLIRIRDVKRGYTNTYTKENYEEKYIVKDGDLIIGMDGEFNIAPWKSDNALLNQRVCKIWCLSNEVSERYLLFFLPKALRDIERETSFVTVKHLSVKTINKIEIPIPPIENQREIAKTLDTATELLAMRKQQLAELDSLIKSTFYNMFGDPVTNEKEWEVFRLSDCLSVIGGYAFKSGDFSDEGIPVIKIGNINSGVFHNNGIAFWKYDKKLEKYLLHPNDIVISLTGTVGKEDYANVCILPDKYPDYYLNQRNAKLELNENINVYYLLYILKDTKIKGLLTGISRGIRQANISNADILALNIPLPKVKLQTQFAKIVTKIEEQKTLVKKAIDETQYLFDSLMSEYFE